MDALFLSRLQFALTIGFHYIFPPLSIYWIFRGKVKLDKIGY